MHLLRGGYWATDDFYLPSFRSANCGPPAKLRMRHRRVEQRHLVNGEDVIFHMEGVVVKTRHFD